MKRVITILAIMAMGVPALAQDNARDWDIHRNDRQKLLLAFSELDNGLTLAVRCADGNLEALLTGLPEPEARRETRTLHVAFGEDEFDHQTWNVAMNPAIGLSERPAPFARKLREGGRLQIRVPGGAEGGRDLRYDLTLPASSAAIDEVLTTCRKPLVDPRDALLSDLPEDGLPFGVTWRHAPRPQFPVTRYARGFAVTSCLTAEDGRLRDCVVESEHPGDGGFGEAALRGIRQAMVDQTPSQDGVFRPVMVQFRSSFVMDGYMNREDRARAREQRARSGQRP
ncbi:MAG: hypothetical protein REJ23_16485 [Brevundimonas sp.]|nr:hypothetical protein [Brevundimonas sp.]